MAKQFDIGRTKPRSGMSVVSSDAQAIVDANTCMIESFILEISDHLFQDPRDREQLVEAIRANYDAWTKVRARITCTAPVELHETLAFGVFDDMLDHVGWMVNPGENDFRVEYKPYLVIGPLLGATAFLVLVDLGRRISMDVPSEEVVAAIRELCPSLGR